MNGLNQGMYERSGEGKKIIAAANHAIPILSIPKAQIKTTQMDLEGYKAKARSNCDT